MRNLDRTEKAIADLERDGRMTEHDWRIVDQNLQRIVLETAASLLGKKPKTA